MMFAVCVTIGVPMGLKTSDLNSQFNILKTTWQLCRVSYLSLSGMNNIFTSNKIFFFILHSYKSAKITTPSDIRENGTVIRENCAVVTENCPVITENCTVITENCTVITENCTVITEKIALWLQKIALW